MQSVKSGRPLLPAYNPSSRLATSSRARARDGRADLGQGMYVGLYLSVELTVEANCKEILIEVVCFYVFLATY